ncbi:pentatricopeptide repeat-containing protein isoform X2 [Cinnamomum micranthum f. kanehirae]|uniref:Pentatricopeptide repeat-containing protein isoform X2 n=1 Tax=Cinnamomum micranthum f. kanehirae TaxID=337451 RepID=A0A3S3N803_9MAGN|nr:pentatricopeptide repeat-containing protein isoform X2 [Cinnamomum micranthum f. kanehirae]
MMMKITSSLIKPISQIPYSKSKSLPTTPLSVSVSVWLSESESESSTSSTSNTTIISEIEAILKTTPSIVETPLERLVPRISASIVASFLQQHQHRDDPQSAFRFFAWAMRRMRFNSWVSHNSMIRILQGEREGENGFKAAWKVLDELKGGGIPIVPHVFAVLMHAYAKSGMAANAIESFGKMHEYKCRPNTFVYNTVLHILMEEKAFHAVMAVYNQMIKCHCPPNRPTFNILIHGLCKKGMIKDADRLLEEMTEKRGISPNTMIITCFARHTYDAHKFLRSLKEKNCHPDTITCNALLSRFCKLGQIHEALRLLKLFQTEGGYVLGLNGYSCLIDGLFRTGRFEEACQLYRNMLEENISPDCILYTIMIKGCLEAGKVKDAFSFLGEMIKRGLVPDTFCYNTLIKGLCDAGLLDKAESLKLKLEISKQKGFPDSATHTIMICGHCKEGLVPNAQKVQGIFDEMEKHGCFPTMMTFNALIDGLCRAGEVKEAFDLFVKMEDKRSPAVFLQISEAKVDDSASLQMYIERLCDAGRVLGAYKLSKNFVDLVDSGVTPDVITYNILINGFGKARLEDSSDQEAPHKYIEDALFEHMKLRECSPDAVTYRTLITAAFRKERFLKGLELWLEYIAQKADFSTPEEMDKAMEALLKHFKRRDIEAVVRGLLAIDLKHKDFDPAPYTIWLIELCRGKRVDDAHKIFSVLTKCDINVTPPSCVALITGLCREREIRGCITLPLCQTEEEGGFKVVEVADSLASSLKQVVTDSYVATMSTADASVKDIQDWCFSKWGILVEVKRRSWSLFWIKPSSQEEFSKLAELDSVVDDCLIRRVDRWTEVLCPVLHPIWVRLEGIPLHAWDEKVFQRLGECLGTVMEIDKDATSGPRIDMVRLLILRDSHRRIPEIVALEVDGAHFCVSIAEEDDTRCIGKIR